MLTQDEINRLVELRRELHQQPELSGKETLTSREICDFLNSLNPDRVITKIGHTGVLASWTSDKAGPNILLRAELDALPIQEENNEQYASKTSGVSHKCGHDGHMSILCGVAILLNRAGITSGSVSLLFQPAEETGEGARLVLKDARFSDLTFDYAFALHNIPGEESGTVLSKAGTFCMASKGLKFSLKGQTAHASQPQTGINPTESIVQLTHFINHSLESIEFTSTTLATITHVNIGEPTLGISPGEGQVWVTIRAEKDHDLDLLESLIKTQAKDLSQKKGLHLGIEEDEAFHTTLNSSIGHEIIQSASEAIGIPFETMQQPNPWSEDFGLFLNKYTGAIFGLGAGKNLPQLHNPDYNFPDDLIEKGVQVFWSIIQECIKKAT